MGKEITCLLVYCIYHVTAYENNHPNINDDVTYGNGDVMDMDNFPYTQTPLRPYIKGPPNVAFLIIDVQVSFNLILFYLVSKNNTKTETNVQVSFNFILFYLVSENNT